MFSLRQHHARSCCKVITVRNLVKESVARSYISMHCLPERKTRGKLQETEGSNPWDW
jgi:hypothetical protein